MPSKRAEADETTPTSSATSTTKRSVRNPLSYNSRNKGIEVEVEARPFRYGLVALEIE